MHSSAASSASAVQHALRLITAEEELRRRRELYRDAVAAGTREVLQGMLVDLHLDRGIEREWARHSMSNAALMRVVEASHEATRVAASAYIALTVVHEASMPPAAVIAGIATAPNGKLRRRALRRLLRSSVSDTLGRRVAQLVTALEPLVRLLTPPPGQTRAPHNAECQRMARSAIVAMRRLRNAESDWRLALQQATC